MDWASRCAQLSYARRLQVGAVIVKDDTVISYGYNGMPSGWDNNCEYEVTEFQTEYGVGSKLVKTGELKTRPEVLHAESNAIAKLAKSNNSGLGATLFVTHAPCIECAKLIYQSGISNVLYRNSYRDSAGVAFLKKSGIEVTQIKDDNDSSTV
jgi:dCMP deaminase